MTVPGARAIVADGHTLLLKRHMLRDSIERPAHNRQALRLGLDADALLEVDLQLTADGHWVCLHDSTADRETSVTGPVASLSRAELAGAKQRDNQGGVLDDPVLFFDEAAQILRGAELGRIQIDLKLRRHQLDDAATRRLAAAVAGIEQRFDIGGHDWPAVAAIAPPGMTAGYDPHEQVAADGLTDPKLWLDRWFAAAPGAGMLYLERHLVIAGYLAGVDLVADCRVRGVAVDCWCIEPHRPETPALLRRLVDSGCRQVTTNDPIALEALWRQSS